MSNPRVVLHYDESGWVTVYADEGVTVISVCDHAPEDRLYRMSPEAIPEGMLDGDIGHREDGSPASVRAQAALAEIESRPHLRAVHAAQEDRK